MNVLKTTGTGKTYPNYHKILSSEDVATTEICRLVHKEPYLKNGYLKEHFLLFVVDGTHEIKLGNQWHTVNKGEMILMKKASYVEFKKMGDPNNDYIYESVSFNLKKEILLDFIKQVNIVPVPHTPTLPEVIVHPYGDRLQTFLTSLKPYFIDNFEVDKGLFRMKILELLYDLSQLNHQFLLQLVEINQTVKSDIIHVVEENYYKPCDMADLAFMSGRSLSTFRREFYTLFKTTQAKWIQEKRLNKAKELFTASRLSIAEVCYEVGYENISHFSRLYKNHFGFNPSETKSQKN
ncbi:AraC-like DNA-binding protein [Chitinophaga skermanii]|uniref:AraC-like DNA-binding protein n=1 Tax=Chitinophaga skermanii TaxID=331697 RepID=A0A327Q7C6_9BACT|nr:AraC family transcriptional regulator [Chitinophaga skermanii]RAJ00399.1 AraC-like DNA-binding protein [Chitinophaga skermanii]